MYIYNILAIMFLFGAVPASREYVDTKVSQITNDLPHIYLAQTEITRQFNPYFTVSRTFSPGTVQNTYVVITSNDTIRIPVNVLSHNDIELTFMAKFPVPSSYSTENKIIWSSDDNILPSITWSYYRNYSIRTIINKYYPNKITNEYDLELFENKQPVYVQLKLEKGSGLMTLFMSNTVNNVSCYYNGGVNVNRANGYWEIKQQGGIKYNNEFMLNVDSLVLKMDDIEEKLIGQYSSDYKLVNKLFSDIHLGNENGIKLSLATTNDYGFVKPDGNTIYIDDNGRLCSAGGGGGGASTEEIVGMVSKTNMSFFVNPTQQSIVGNIQRVSSLTNDVSNLSNRVETLQGISIEILEELRQYNSRLEAALGN